MKALSVMLKMPLIVEVAMKHNHYELFYYEESMKEKNKNT
jgi:hypothetical protein